MYNNRKSGTYPKDYDPNKKKVTWADLKKPKRELTYEEQIAKIKRKQGYMAGAVWVTIWIVGMIVAYKVLG